MIDIEISKKVFNEVYIPHLDSDKKYRFEHIYGGAGSGKSVFVAQKKVYQHLRDVGRKTLVVRKVGKTSRHSTFAEIRSVIGTWDCEKLFKINKSDLEITNYVNRNQFIFTGLDDVEKLKSIHGITDVWIEEAAEITREDFQQLNLRLRGIGPIPKQITFTYNPISALSWIKADFHDAEVDNGIILKTTYKHNRFLDEEYIGVIEDLKNKDPIYYQIYALGNWGVLGNLVFTNYEVESFDIKDENGNFLFEKVFNGIDWGFNDPSALVRIGLRDSELYVFDGLYAKGLTNTELIDEAENVITRGDLFTADSSEPARIKEWRKKGFNVRSAKKGKDSVRFGIDFIRRHRIHIHPSMQEFINEIQGYVYKKDKDGNTLEEPLDFKNHYMDAMRYALEELSYERKLRFG